MSEVRLVICDAHREVQAKQHGSFADRVIAALSAEPETIEELDAALERFMARGKGTFFGGFSASGGERPHDAGLVIVDLAARLVVCDSTYSAANPEGVVEYHDGNSATDLGVGYHLSDDWLLSDDATDWRVQAAERRLRRAAEPPLDVRKVVYGEPLLRFIAGECLEAFHGQGMPAKADWADPAYQREYDLVRDIHVRWMMESRHDLRGQSPRQAMLAKRDFICADLQDRELQWSRTGQCPPGLNRDSAAYRLAGFGTHELVSYYELARELMWACRHNVADCESSKPEGLNREDFIAGEIERLAEMREWWFDSPDPEFHGRTPRSIMHNERVRIPEAMSPEESIVDPDCPFCEMQAELPGPVFWHLDGSGMDDDFAFSLWHETRDEWEAEQHQHEEFNRRFEEQHAEETRLGVRFPGDGWVDPDLVWKMSFSARHYSEAPLAARLFAIGMPLSELIVDLQRLDEEAFAGENATAGARDGMVSGLRHTYCQLRDTVEAQAADDIDATLGILTGLRDGLENVARAYPDLAFQCGDLKERVSRFLEPTREMDDEELFDLNSLPC